MTTDAEAVNRVPARSIRDEFRAEEAADLYNNDQSISMPRRFGQWQTRTVGVKMPELLTLLARRAVRDADLESIVIDGLKEGTATKESEHHRRGIEGSTAALMVVVMFEI